jgi:hypothetical protein
MDEVYYATLDLILQIDDDQYREGAIEGLIQARVRREQGFNDPGGPLAMRLRREAFGIEG